jgi:alkanesulfonate monooxygenase SsuD/methylene tetrahydromethanopterin reductase-like flavin-dependent oxidoreductase (luciferase family)
MQSSPCVQPSDAAISTGPRLALRFDLRAPAFGADISQLYRGCVELCEAADRWGFERVFLAEHHGSEDRYCPSPITIGAAIASRTSHIRINPAAVVAPLHDPLRIAEDLAVLDIISNGRLDVILGAGYLESEFAMFGADISNRGASMDESLDVLKQAWTGEWFTYRGRRVRVTPRPLQEPRPPIFLGGMSKPAARRAARSADGFWPINGDLTDTYLEECRRLGMPPGVTAPIGYAVVPFESPRFVFVSDDPDRDWPKILRYALHDTNEYARMLGDAPKPSRTNVPAGFTRGPLSAEDIRAGGTYMVLTPEDCAQLYMPIARKHGMITIHPSLAGLDPEMSENSLTLFAEKVLPRLRGDSIGTDFDGGQPVSAR